MRCFSSEKSLFGSFSFGVRLMTLPHNVALRFGCSLFVISEHSSKIRDFLCHGCQSGIQFGVAILLGRILLGRDIE